MYYFIYRNHLINVYFEPTGWCFTNQAKLYFINLIILLNI